MKGKMVIKNRSFNETELFIITRFLMKLKKKQNLVLEEAMQQGRKHHTL